MERGLGGEVDAEMDTNLWGLVLSDDEPRVGRGGDLPDDKVDLLAPVRVGACGRGRSVCV